MRPRRVKFTLRRLMIALAVVTIASVLGGNFLRHATARWDYERFRTYYFEGRVLAGSCGEKSRQLLDAHLALCLTSWDRTEAITAHVERLSRLADEERQRWLGLELHASSVVDVYEIEQMLSEAKGMLKRADGAADAEFIRKVGDSSWAPPNENQVRPR